MKKLNFWLLANLFIGSLAFTACGSDDDGNNQESGTADKGGDAPSFTIVGTWKTTNSGDGMSYSEIITLQEGNACIYRYEKTASDGASMWEEKTGTWSEKDGKITANFTKMSWFDGRSSEGEDNVDISEKMEFGYIPFANGILAYSSKMSKYNFYSSDGSVIGLDNPGSELIGYWEVIEPPTDNLIIHRYFSFKADGSMEEGGKVWAISEGKFIQGSYNKGYFIQVASPIFDWSEKVPLAEGTKPLAALYRAAYMWDMINPDGKLMNIIDGGYPLCYVISGGKLYVGRYGMTVAQLKATDGYEKK